MVQEGWQWSGTGLPPEHDGKVSASAGIPAPETAAKGHPSVPRAEGGMQLVKKGGFGRSAGGAQGITITAQAVPGDNMKGRYHVAPESSSLASLISGYFDQFNENDAEVMARLSRQLGAVRKARGDCWIFAWRETGISSAGKPLPSLSITRRGKHTGSLLTEVSPGRNELFIPELLNQSRRMNCFSSLNAAMAV